ncbi:PilZ domain-containing protein [Bacillus sp. BRMEA1]|uniref:PilZ domain-containing protein n=1 Tax=Neobacillus endophyticus TaxID=2738405 RepID=UPI001567803B|nr:PilZ domain-containing protein [Neobacillus endophyticus]NRD76887.1 PilZ domain-containing protein [Neobacillus endophyticus]
MSIERRQFGRVDFENSIQLMILEPVPQKAELEDASFNGLKIVTELDVDLETILTCQNIELDNSIPFKARIIWKKTLENGYFQYGLQIQE